MNVKNWMSSCVLMSGLLAVPLAYANQPGHQRSDDADYSQKWQEKKEEKIQKLYSQLNLTDDQKKQLEANKQKNRAARKEVFEKMKSSREALNQELMQPDLNMNKVNEIQSQLKS